METFYCIALGALLLVDIVNMFMLAAIVDGVHKESDSNGIN